MANGDDQGGGGGQDPASAGKVTAETLKQVAAEKELSKTVQQRVQDRIEENANLQKAVQTLQALDNVEMSRARRAARMNEMIEMQLKQEQNKLEILELEYKQAIANQELTDAAIQEYENQLKIQREITKELNDQHYISEGMATAQEDIASAALKFAGVTGKMNLTAKFAGFVGQAGSLTQAFSDLADEIGNTASKAQMINATSAKISEGIMGIVAMMIEQALALDSVLSQTVQNLNVNREYASTIDDVYQAQKLNGLSAQQAGESFQSLHTQMSSFSQQSEGMRMEITQTGAQLSQLGVSAGSFADGMDLSVQALRMSADEARRTQTDLARFAGELGMAPETMAAGFAQAGPSLAKFGANAVKSFKNVAKAAKETGIEMNRIMDYTAQFDTFEGAAERVGALNAALGGDYLNTMDLMEETDPAKRIQMITDAISASGKSFEEMGYYEKQMFAQAGGFSDVEELSRAMSGSLDDNATSTENAAMSQEELAEINRQNLSLQQKMAATLAELAPGIMKVVEALHRLMMPIMKFVEVAGAYVLPILIGLRIHFFRLQMQQAANMRELTRYQLAQARDTAAKVTNSTSTAANTAAEQANAASKRAGAAADIQAAGAEAASTTQTNLNTGAQNLNNTSKLAAIGRAVKMRIVTMAAAMAHGAEAMGLGVVTGALGIKTGATVAATIASLTLGKALIIATGGLILIIPAVIGIVMAFKALIEKFGLARTIGIALAATLAIIFLPIIKIPLLIAAAFYTLYTYWDEIVAGIKAGAKFLFDVITGPFVLAFEAIKGLWNYFFGASMSPFMQDIVNGIVAAGKAIINFLTWPYRMAYNIITGVWDNIVGFIQTHWETIKSIAMTALQIIGRAILFWLTGGMSEVVLFIFNSWDQIKEYASAAAEFVYAGFKKIAGVGKFILDALKAPFNWLIGMVNSFLSGIEKALTLIIRVPKVLPGPSRYQIGPPNLGRIPELAKGTDNFEGGTALVGEQGPELVNMPKGTAVSPAGQTKKFGQTLQNIAMTSAQIAGAIAKLTPAAPVAGAIQKVAGVAGGAGKQQPVTINVTLELDKRVLARHVEEVMVDKLNPATA